VAMGRCNFTRIEAGPPSKCFSKSAVNSFVEVFSPVASNQLMLLEEGGSCFFMDEWSTISMRAASSSHPMYRQFSLAIIRQLYQHSCQSKDLLKCVILATYRLTASAQYTAFRFMSVVTLRARNDDPSRTKDVIAALL